MTLVTVLEFVRDKYEADAVNGREIFERIPSVSLMFARVHQKLQFNNSSNSNTFQLQTKCNQRTNQSLKPCPLYPLNKLPKNRPATGNATPCLRHSLLTISSIISNTRCANTPRDTRSLNIDEPRARHDPSLRTELSV